MSDLQALGLLAALVAAVAGLWVYLKISRAKAYAKAKLSWPKTWVHVGTPPPKVDIALEIIGKNCPGLPQAGTIEWVSAPFLITVFGHDVLAAGTVLSYEPIHVKVEWSPSRMRDVSQTALAHEIGHVWSEQTGQGFGESPYDKRFVAWFMDVNRQISEAI